MGGGSTEAARHGNAKSTCHHRNPGSGCTGSGSSRCDAGRLNARKRTTGTAAIARACTATRAGFDRHVVTASGRCAGSADVTGAAGAAGRSDQ